MELSFLAKETKKEKQKIKEKIMVQRNILEIGWPGSLEDAI